MAIRYHIPPARSLHALRMAGNQLRPALSPTLRTLGRVFPIDRTTDEPVEQAFPVYFLGLDQIVERRRGLRGARQIGWRYLIDDELSATVLVERDRDRHNFGSFTRGRLPAALARQIIELHENPRLQQRTVEPSLLEIPALRVTALWLRDTDQNPANDLLLTILSDQRALPEGKLLTADEFLAVLVEPARAGLASTGES